VQQECKIALLKKKGVPSDFVQKLLDQLQWKLSLIGAARNMNA